MSETKNGGGWFMSYAFSLSNGSRIQMGATTWKGGETPWERLSRWAKELPHRQFVLISWKELSSEEFFDWDSETDK